MKLPTPVNLIAGLAIIGIAAVSMGQLRSIRQDRPPISLEELADREVVGTFGFPLGTIIELKGTIVPNPGLSKGESGALYTQVDEINGRVLDKPIVSSRIGFLSQREAKPGVGDRFRVFGYESGGYSGVVPGEEKFGQVRQDRGFGFCTGFHELKVEWVRRS